MRGGINNICTSTKINKSQYSFLKNESVYTPKRSYSNESDSDRLFSQIFGIGNSNVNSNKDAKINEKKESDGISFSSIFGNFQDNSFNTPEKSSKEPEEEFDDVPYGNNEEKLKKRKQRKKEREETIKDIFDTIRPQAKFQSSSNTPLSSLKYLQYYPRPVRKWVEDAKAPRGYYDWLGIWRTQSLQSIENTPSEQTREAVEEEDDLNKIYNKFTPTEAAKELLDEEIRTTKQEMALSEHLFDPNSTVTLPEFFDKLPFEDREAFKEEIESIPDSITEDDKSVLLAKVNRMVGKGETKTLRKMYPPPERDSLDADLVGEYRFQITREEGNLLSEKLRRVLSFRYATDREIMDFRLRRECAKWEKFQGDTGNTAVQITRLTLKINYFKIHTQNNKKDQRAKLKLRMMVRQRRKLMQYLKYRDVKTYFEVVKEYLLEDVIGRYK